MLSRLGPLLGALLAALLITAACSDPEASGGAQESTERDPTGGGSDVGIEAEVSSRDGHPLIAELVVRSDEPIAPRVRAVADDHVVEPPVTEPGAEHTIALLGLRPERTYRVEIHDDGTSGDDTSTDGASDDGDDGDEAGDGALATVEHTTGALPEDMPELEVAVSEPERMAPGLTLFNLLDSQDLDALVEEGVEGEEAPRLGWLVAVDESGEVVWFHRADHPIGDVRRLDDGTLLHEYNDTGARRIDMFGDVLDEWAGDLVRDRLLLDQFGRQVAADDAVPVDADSMHHEVNRLPDGNQAVISTELRTIDGFAEPRCDEDPDEFDGRLDIVGDVIVVHEPDTGEVVWRRSLFDLYDPVSDEVASDVCGLPFPDVFPNWAYVGVSDDPRDWTHANAVVLDEERNALLVSIRHFDLVIALRYRADESGPAGELLWELGELGDLELTGDGDWPYHQHAPHVLEDGSILLYDNGNERPGHVMPDAPDDTQGPPVYSRAVRYEIDDEAGTVRQVWEHRSQVDGEEVYASFVGDADHLDNGNVLITDGGLNGTPDDISAQIVEVVPGDDDGGEPVFTLRIREGDRWIVYRAERIAGLYPDR